MTPGEHDSPLLDDDLALWLARFDERLAAGESVRPLEDAAVPSALRPRLEVETAWCELVRRIWHLAEDREPPEDPELPEDRGSPEARESPHDRELPSTAPGPRNEASSRDQPPSEVGRFVIRHELGRGAFGIVYLAHDPQLRREVALKVPRGEVLSSELRARFRNEAMAAAGLDHPNIVPVYEAGEAGPICYIASAFCPGITLAAWLRRRARPVPPRMAAGLVARLADAVAHAHRRGVLHRDLKPSNVLLEMPGMRAEDWQGDDDGYDPVPRVTDFGLAKVMGDGPAANATLNPTRNGVLMGTPRYMAPEQTQGQPGGVGPAADVYGLGVILYEVLTGRPPFQGDSVLDTLVLVRTQDPLPPSKLRPRLPRDLETICLKCLQKQPAARYGKADELAQDLQRFLAAQPIRARPTPALERAVKWVRRHPAVATLTGAGTLAAFALAVVILLANVRLKHERNRAEARRLEAVANLQKAREAVDRMLTRVSEERLRGIPQVEPVQRALLEDALEFYRGFARDAHDDPEILLEASRAYYRLGRTYAFFARKSEGEASYREAMAIQEKLVAAHPTVAANRYELAQTQVALARLWRELDRPAEAETVLGKASKLVDELITAEPDNGDYPALRAHLINTRGSVLGDLGRREASQTDYRTAIELFEALSRRYPAAIEHRTGAGVCRNNLAVAVEEDSRLDEAEALYRRNVELWEGLARRDAANPDHRSKLALTCENLWILLEKRGRKAEAEKSIRRVTELRGSLTKDFPNTPYYFEKLAGAFGALAKYATERGSVAEAGRLQQQAIVARRTALALAPEAADYRRNLVTACADRAQTLIALRDHDEATKVAIELASVSRDSAPDIVRAAALVACCVPLAAGDPKLPDTGRARRAEAYALQAVDLIRQAAIKGFRDGDAIRNDRHFDSLRDRPDFGAALAGLNPTPAAVRPPRVTP